MSTMSGENQQKQMRCQGCRKTPQDIAQEDHIRIPTVKYDVRAKRVLCNHCWMRSNPSAVRD